MNDETPMNLDDFKCLRCGACCRVRGGVVRISDVEISRMSAALHLDERDFINRFATLSSDRHGLVLKDQNDGASCILLDENGACKVHDAKPDQCRNFPFSWRNSDSESYCKGLQKLNGKTMTEL